MKFNITPEDETIKRNRASQQMKVSVSVIYANVTGKSFDGRFELKGIFKINLPLGMYNENFLVAESR
jgi:hypothetical protein